MNPRVLLLILLAVLACAFPAIAAGAVALLCKRLHRERCLIWGVA